MAVLYVKLIVQYQDDKALYLIITLINAGYILAMQDLRQFYDDDISITEKASLNDSCHFYDTNHAKVA
ncbi:hypothetical protein V1477_012956 [Vespula maculifrons]|uniref:Uncharacterized protein n=1 Tax=Vespula maculifrons TaxID=7453 RepID=A0ABD2BUJ6_VESMC